MPKTDLIEVDKVLKDKVEKSFFVFNRDHHKWYYLSEQRNDEPFIFATWVSESNGETYAGIQTGFACSLRTLKI